jgi:hypothetical protein
VCGPLGRPPDLDARGRLDRPRARIEPACEQGEKRRLAGPVRAEERYPLAGMDVQADRMESSVVAEPAAGVAGGKKR